MIKKKINNEIYKMYEEEVNKNIRLEKENRNLKLEVYSLKLDLKIANNKIQKEIEKTSIKYEEKINDLQSNLNVAHNEIKRLKEEIANKENTYKDMDDKNYLIDKLNNQMSKDSTNSSISTSKESTKNSNRRRTNTYNHRKASNKKTGAQFNHKGSTLTKNKVKNKIEENKLEVREFKHYVSDKKYNNIVEKYKVGIEVKTYVEKHIFIPRKSSNELLPKEFYSDVTYCNDIKALIVLLGNYCFLPYNKIKELISDLTNNVINLADGTIDKIYNEFSDKSEKTLLNITKNLLNGTYQHTDETVTSENGKDTYYRGYANSRNVLYKYHTHKGDKPIEEDGILTDFFGTLITDHDVGMFKYGTNNQDCIIHFGRYCIEQDQNISITCWQMKLYKLLLKFEKNRKILMKFKCSSFSKEDIILMEKEYDDILELAKVENEFIPSTYWKEKANTLLNRCIKYKKQMLFYIYDFTISYDNNFMERALRMIKGKTKISGGFRSYNGGIRFGNIMSIIKTSKLRSVNPFLSITNIMNNDELFIN